MTKAIYIAVLIALVSACSTKPKKAEAPKEDANKVIDTKKVEVVKTQVEKPHWGYEGLFGPELWGNLDPSYITCKEGQEQSPVDLIWKKPIDGGIIEFSYKAMPLIVTDTGYNLQLQGNDASMVNLRGTIYSLSHVSVHSPSEHTFSGKAADAELQFVHVNTNGEYSIISVLINEGNENPELYKLINNVSLEKGKPNVTNETIDFINLIPESKTYYHYMGSFTKPPCMENVNWNIFNTSISASKAQLDKLKSYYNNNTRPLQPLNARQTTNY